MLILTQNVEIEEKEGWIKCDRAEFDLSKEEDYFTAEGSVELEFEVE